MKHRVFGSCDKLGPYEILALFGAGGMGAVYRAIDPQIGLGCHPTRLDAAPDYPPRAAFLKFSSEPWPVFPPVLANSSEGSDGLPDKTMS